MNKKFSLFLSVIIIFCIIFSLNVTAADATLSNRAAEALEILQVLGIVSEEYDELTLDTGKLVTRAEFAAYIRKFANLEEKQGTVLYYNDVSKNHYAYNDITLLTEYGYMCGVGNKLFAPEEAMVKEHAYSIFLNLLGYAPYVEANSVAQGAVYTGINEGVSAQPVLTTGDLFMIMYNSLLADCAEVEVISAGDAKYTRSQNSYLYNTRNMEYYEKGTVTGVHGASIYNTVHSYEQMIIDNRIIELDRKDYFGYLGLNVRYIIEISEDDDEYRLVWITKGSSNDTVTLFVDEDSVFDRQNNVLKHVDENDKEKKYQLADNITVIYNGGFYSGSTYEVLDRDKYELTLLSIKKDNDVAIVWAYDNVLVRGRDITMERVYDNLTNTYVNIDPDEYDVFSLTTTTGEEITVEDIEDNDVISIYKSQYDRFFRGVLSRKTVSGDIFGSEDGRILVEDEYYEYYDISRLVNNTAKSVEMYLDYKGYIADASFSYVSSNRFVAYAYSVLLNDLDSCLIFKVLNENGMLESLETTETVRFNSAKAVYYDVYDNMTKGTSGRVRPQLVLLQKNTDGKITAVYTSSENGGGDALIKHQEMTGQNVWACQAAAEQNIIGVTMLYDENTKVFNVPADEDIRSASDSKFSVSSVKNDGKYRNAVSYKVTRDDIFYEQYIVSKEALSLDIAENDKFVQVAGMNKGVNADDEVVDFLKIVEAGAAISKYSISEDCEFSDVCKSGTAIEDLSEGDVIRTVMQDDEIVKIELVYKHNYNDTDFFTGNFFYGDGGWGLGQFGLVYGESRLRIFSCTVKAKLGAAFKCETGYTGREGNNQVLNLAKDNALIVIYDGENFYKGTYNDINPGDFIIVQTHYNDNIAVAVYKR